MGRNANFAFRSLIYFTIWLKLIPLRLIVFLDFFDNLKTDLGF
jgi:hypothetical protein